MSKEFLFKTRNDWRTWLKNNGAKEKEVWLIYYKIHVEKTSVFQDEAVEEALCFGWIDSIVKRLDEERYMQKYTPRNEKSIWSDKNKSRVAILIKDGKMTEAGMDKIKIAKMNGSWDKIQTFANILNIPNEFETALSKNDIAKSNFEQLAPSYKKQYIYWIGTAKKEETKKRRSEKAIHLLVKNKKLGIV
jgi:uncharacterized protein YdeI (YjbR/CyaY-like superfamily)